MILPILRIDASEFTLAAAEWEAQAAAMPALALAITRHWGMLLQTKVKAYASKPRTGPPGPRIQTGDYVRSISLVTGVVGGSPVATVGTNKPQGRRLEYGFVGTDSLGRNYNQPPYPHFRPALWEVRPAYIAAIAAMARGTT